MFTISYLQIKKINLFIKNKEYNRLIYTIYTLYIIHYIILIVYLFLHILNNIQFSLKKLLTLDICKITSIYDK
jgi:hypothetical protein